MVPTTYAIPYSELSAAVAADNPASSSRATELPVVSAWMSRALGAILSHADQIDVDTKDGICTASEISAALDAGVLAGATGQYAVGRLLDSPASMDYLSRTPGATSNPTGLILADWQPAFVNDSRVGSIRLGGTEITPEYEEFNVEVKSILSSYNAFLAQKEANGSR